jgi:hypothetical protein
MHFCNLAGGASLQALLVQHQTRSAQLAKERLELARKQAEVLRGYVTAGLSVPVRTGSSPRLMPPSEQSQQTQQPRQGGFVARYLAFPGFCLLHWLP